MLKIAANIQYPNLSSYTFSSWTPVTQLFFIKKFNSDAMNCCLPCITREVLRHPQYWRLNGHHLQLPVCHHISKPLQRGYKNPRAQPSTVRLNSRLRLLIEARYMQAPLILVSQVDNCSQVALLIWKKDNKTSMTTWIGEFLNAHNSQENS